LNKNVKHWRQIGSISLWRYRDATKNCAGWHLFADKAGEKSLLELLQALLKATEAIQRTIQLTKPTPEILSIPNHGRAIWSPTKWLLAYDPQLDATAKWTFPPDVDPALLSIGIEFCKLLTDAVEKWSEGLNDFSIGPAYRRAKHSMRLLFW